MRNKLIIGFIIIASFGTFGFVKYSTFFKIDKCLDSGGSWNYQTKECEHSPKIEILQTKLIEVLIGTKWCARGYQSFPSDTLTFKAQNKVEYFMGELSWIFDSHFEQKGDTVIIETCTMAFEVADISGMKPDLLQKYLLKSNSMKLIYLANYRNNKWIVASHERYDFINDFKRVE